MRIHVFAAAAALCLTVPAVAETLPVPIPPVHKIVHKHHRHHHWGVMQLQLFVPPTSSPKGKAPAPVPAPATDPVLSIVQQLQATLPHWQAADAVAVGADPKNPINPRAHRCFAEVIGFLQGLTTVAPAQGTPADSPIVAYAKAQSLHSQITPGLPPELISACASLVETQASFLSRIAAMDGLNISADELSKAGF